jgi:hypothetical protein
MIYAIDNSDWIFKQDAIENNSFYGEPQVLVDGDVEKGFTESDIVISGEYQTGLQVRLLC